MGKLRWRWIAGLTLAWVAVGAAGYGLFSVWVHRQPVYQHSLFLHQRDGKWFRRHASPGKCVFPQGHVALHRRPGARTVVVLGSSLSYGVYFRPDLAITPQTPWEMVAAAWTLAEEKGLVPPVDIVNLAYPGANSLSLACLAKEAAALHPDAAFVQATNNEASANPSWETCVGVAPLAPLEKIKLVLGRRHTPGGGTTCVRPSRPLGHALDAYLQAFGAEALVLVIPPHHETLPNVLAQGDLSVEQMANLQTAWRRGTGPPPWFDTWQRRQPFWRRKAAGQVQQALTARQSGDNATAVARLAQAQEAFRGALCATPLGEREQQRNWAGAHGAAFMDLQPLLRRDSPTGFVDEHWMVDSCHGGWALQVWLAEVMLRELAVRFAADPTAVAALLPRVLPPAPQREQASRRALLAAGAFLLHKETPGAFAGLVAAHPGHGGLQAMAAAAEQPPGVLSRQPVFLKQPVSHQNAMTALSQALHHHDDLSDLEAPLRRFVAVFAPADAPTQQEAPARPVAVSGLPLTLPSPWTLQQAVCRTASLDLLLSHPDGLARLRLSREGAAYAVVGAVHVSYLPIEGTVSYMPEQGTVPAFQENAAQALATALEALSETGRTALLAHCNGGSSDDGGPPGE